RSDTTHVQPAPLAATAFRSCAPLLIRSLLHFFFNDPATTETYTLSLHDALPILTPASWAILAASLSSASRPSSSSTSSARSAIIDRKSTRLNSSHLGISYAVFCLKKKNRRLVNAIRALLYTLRLLIRRERSSLA